MKQSLINYLQCLSCKNNLYLVADSNSNEIPSGYLKCKNCKQEYPILNGVPIFTSENLNPNVKLTAQNFAYSWQVFSRTNKELYKKQFFDWINPIDESFLKNKFVLDAGCGKGHHLAMISQYVKEGIGVDISNSVFIAYNHTKHLPNIHIIKADLNVLPLKDEIFDYIYSTGVIHHTESPERTTKNIYKKLKRGASMSIWIYGKENNGWIIYFIDPIRKFISNNFHPKAIRIITFFLAIVLYLILKVIYLPVTKVKFLNPLKNILFYYSYLSYISSYDFNEIDNIIFDHIVAPISHYLSKEEVERMVSFDSAKSKIEWHNKNSWRILTKKP